MADADRIATCYRCNTRTGTTCPRCGRPYCADHGGDICADCADPTAATPGSAWYRGSVLALVAVAAVGIWLLIAPPDLTDSESDGGPTGDIGEPVATSTATGSAATATSTPTGETYTVQPGDTLAAIADRFETSVDDLAAANDIAPDDVIVPGQELVIPP